MQGAVTISRWFGIPVQLHWTFILVVAWLFYRGWEAGWDVQQSLRAGLPLLALFGCVILHEFGHALTARRYGVVTRDIVLSPIGGVARMTRLPDKPMQEMWVAAAGPLVNLALGGLLLIPVLLHEATRQRLIHLFDTNSNFLFLNLNLGEYLLLSLLLLNGLLAIFNLLPAFPMDGGRILRALLSIRFGRRQATLFATRLGQGLAIVFVIYGLWSQQNYLLVFIGFFVFMMGSAEYRSVQLDEWLHKHTIGPLIRREFSPIKLSDPMEVPAEISSQGPQHHFPVLNETEEVCGILSGKDLMRAVKEKAFDQPVSDYFVPTGLRLQPDANLKDAVHMLQEGNMGALPVYENGELVGLLDVETIEQALKKVY